MHPGPEISFGLRHEAHPRDERLGLGLPLGRGIGHETVARRQRAELLDAILQEAARQVRGLLGAERRAEPGFHFPRHGHLRHGGNGDPAGAHRAPSAGQAAAGAWRWPDVA